MDERKLLIVIGIVSFAGLIALLLQPLFISNLENENIAGTGYTNSFDQESLKEDIVHVTLNISNQTQKTMAEQLITITNNNLQSEHNYILQIVE